MKPSEIFGLAVFVIILMAYIIYQHGHNIK